MPQVIDGVDYKCRSKVLAAFFKTSRDKWKQRCLQTKRLVKRLTNRAADDVPLVVESAGVTLGFIRGYPALV
jgi:hypothetical protein